MSTYFASNIIVLNQNGTQYTYTIIKEGYYPQNDILYYTSARSCNNTQFKIPDDYLIQTSWGREKIPVFKISFGENFQASVESIHSATKAANAYLQIKKPNTQARLSGVHVFCLNSQELEKERERKSALQPELPCETTIYKTKKRINKEMNNTIPISILNISNQPTPTPINENSDINDPEIVEEVLKYIGKAGYHKITDILLFILPDLINRRVINPDNPIINLRISGDRRNVGRKVKHVIITCVILDDIVNLHKSDYHYTIILYLGTENYELLQRMIEPISNELNDLVLNGLRDSNGTIWIINPYFSSDWKFMAIVLGFNAPNSKHFCPWCFCTKENIGNKHKLKPPPGHIKSPLLQMIPLSHYVPDELHIMLRIWDRLWDLVLQELKIQNQFNDLARAKILAEMRRISILFNFWQEQGMQNWSYTSLMGGDKEKMGLYRPKDVTPYMHVLVHHLPEFME
ncbi:hypothetical protein C1646_797857 [Rhizophagus diaphanus]|nr:hypothetical protein C1646_797857 [Rhizophagus diaphanus] [Rhizophagus sp. MUCL 43196]